jgi:hypothetical protein
MQTGAPTDRRENDHDCSHSGIGDWLIGPGNIADGGSLRRVGAGSLKSSIFVGENV